MERRSMCTRALPVLITVAATVTAGCFHRKPKEAPLPAPVVQEVIAVPGAAVTRPEVEINPSPMMAESPEPFIDMRMVDAPVALVLQRIAELGKLDLIIPGNLNKTITVHFIHVRVSEALKDVLTRTGLRLGTATTAPLPFDTVTVFYHLPANVDSMSVDAIIRRFGVSRAMAELIVKSRRP